MNLNAMTILLCIGSTIPLVFGANILCLFPYPGKSHFDFFRPLFLGLADAGHELTVVSYFPNKEPVANYTDLVLDGLPIIVNDIDLKLIELLHYWLRDIRWPTFFFLNSIGYLSCEAAFGSKAIEEVLQSNKKYDVVLTEYFVNDCMLAISHKLNAPVIGLTSHALMPWHYKRMGSPFVSSYMPNHFLSHSNEMGFFQRLNNLMHQRIIIFFHDFFCQRATNKLIQKHFGNSVPPIEELVLNTSLLLINQHFSLNGPTPYVPGIVEVAGLHITEPKALDSELQQLLDNAKNGAIYVSWGSLVRPDTLPNEKKKALIKALAQFDQLIILKWPSTSIRDPPKNFYLRDWMPQKDILCHPNVKVFMTHGGLLGSTEGSYCGVSLVITPFFGDQYLNAEAIKYRNAGVVLNYLDLQEENIVKALQTALSPSMQERAKFISDAFRHRPQTPLKLAIWWVENIIRTKGANLGVNASSRMNWITHNNLDVYAVLLIAFLLAFISLRWFVKRVICARRKQAAKPKKSLKLN